MTVFQEGNIVGFERQITYILSNVQEIKEDLLLWFLYIIIFDLKYEMLDHLGAFFYLTSSIAFFIASSANIEQCNFTGGSFKYLAISEFFISRASSIFMPLITYVAYEDEAIADPQPNVLNTAFSIVLPSSPT